MVLVKGLEVGRTTTIPNSSEPMWATDFRLPDSLLCETNPPRGNPQTAGDSGGGGRLRPPLPPCPRAARVSGTLTLEVWNRVPEGDPVLLGAVEVPSDLLQEVMSSPAPPDKDERGVSGEDRGTAGEIEGWSPRLHSIDLNLESPVKHTKQRQLTETGHDESSMVDTVAATLPAAAEAYGGTGGVLSLSLRRVFAIVRPSTSTISNGPGAIAESLGLLSNENGSDPEAKVPGTRISEVGMFYTLAAKVFIRWCRFRIESRAAEGPQLRSFESRTCRVTGGTGGAGRGRYDVVSQPSHDGSRVSQ